MSKDEVVVYLAGGMRNPWRDEVVMQTQGAIFLDPCSHGLSSEEAYTYWDLEAIKKADVVFAYMEQDNPSGAGLAFEIGYAVALGRKVIFVDNSSEAVKKYFGMCRTASTVQVGTMEEGIKLLNYLVDTLSG